MIIALTMGATNSFAEVLRGQLSGLEHQRDRVDLRMRFFSTIDADRLLTELNFDRVELERGTFEVSLEHRALPPDARFVAMALRPSERRYAAFQAIPPGDASNDVPGTVLDRGGSKRSADARPRAITHETCHVDLNQSRRTPMNASTKLLLLLLLTVLAIEGAHGQASSFTYQGQLRQSGEPFTGMADLEFRLYDQLNDGTQIGSTQSVADWPVEDGLFQVELDFGASAFDGSDRYLEVTVDGAPLIPRQKVTATPYALLATGLASGSVGGGSIDPTEVQLRVVGTCPAGEYVQQINQDGSVVCGVDDSGLPGWSLTGNAGTNASTNFIGTTDAVAFEIRTADVRSLRIEPSAEIFGGSPITTNTIAGASANEVLPGVRGATISGGGMPSGDSDPDLGSEAPNRITDHYGTVGGGYANVAGDDSGSVADRPFATVGGGVINIASNISATVGGGQSNSASGENATVAGGVDNSASSFGATVAGGSFNDASDDLATIGGGESNTASGSIATVGGGIDNTASGFYATVGGGLENTASGSRATVGGGQENTASDFYATVDGGVNNTASGSSATVGGGVNNTASGFNAIVGGGALNTASGGNATVGGGFQNTASGSIATVGGGRDNTASGDYSFVVGRRAKNSDASHDGVFIFADSENADFTSTGANQFLVRAVGGVGLGTNAPQAQLHVAESVNANANNSSAHVAIIENTASDTSTGPDVLAVKTSMIDPDTAANLITFFDGNDDAIGRIEGDGAGGIVFASGGADFAEWLPKRDPDARIEAGDVVGWHIDGISHETEGALRVMAVSTQPIVAGNAPPEDELDHWARVGFIGQVPVRVRGPVNAGDWIVASGQEDGTGTARSPESLRPEQLGLVIGQALESNDSESEQRINVAVGLGAHEPFGQALARLQARNTQLQERLAAAEEGFETRLAAVEDRQAQELTALRQELALLRELVAPGLAQEVN